MAALQPRGVPDLYANIYGPSFGSLADTFYGRKGNGVVNADGLEKSPSTALVGLPDADWVSRDADGKATTERYERYLTYPAAKVGNVRFIGRILVGLLNDRDDWLTSADHGLPMVETDDMRIKWSRIKFDQGLLDFETEETVSRIQRFAMEEGGAYVSRKGKQLVAEAGFFHTPQGRELFYLQLQQLQCTAAQTFNYCTINALANVRPHTVNWFMKMNAGERRPIRKLALFAASRFACMQKGLGQMDEVFDNANQIADKRGTRFNTLAISQYAMTFLNRHAEAKLENYFDGGPDAVAKRRRSPFEPVASFKNMAVKYTHGISNFHDDLPFDFLLRERLVGEYYLLLSRDSDEYDNGYADFKTNHLDIYIHDMDGDEMARLSVQEALKHTFHFDENGFLLGPHNNDLGMTDGTLKYSGGGPGSSWATSSSLQDREFQVPPALNGVKNMVGGKGHDRILGMSDDKGLFTSRLPGRGFVKADVLGDIRKEYLSDEYLKELVGWVVELAKKSKLVAEKYTLRRYYDKGGSVTRSPGTLRTGVTDASSAYIENKSLKMAKEAFDKQLQSMGDSIRTATAEHLKKERESAMILKAGLKGSVAPYFPADYSPSTHIAGLLFFPKNVSRIAGDVKSVTSSSAVAATRDQERAQSLDFAALHQQNLQIMQKAGVEAGKIDSYNAVVSGLDSDSQNKVVYHANRVLSSSPEHHEARLFSPLSAYISGNGDSTSKRVSGALKTLTSTELPVSAVSATTSAASLSTGDSLLSAATPLQYNDHNILAVYSNDEIAQHVANGAQFHEMRLPTEFYEANYQQMSGQEILQAHRQLQNIIASTQSVPGMSGKIGFDITEGKPGKTSALTDTIEYLEHLEALSRMGFETETIVNILDIPIHYEMLQFFHDNNIPPPFDIMVQRPFQGFRTGSGICYKGGIDTGANFYGGSNFMWGQDPNPKTYVGHWSLYHDAVIYNTDNVLVLDDLYLYGYTGGRNMRFFSGVEWDRLADHEFAVSTDRNRPSMIASLIPRQFRPKSSVINIAGKSMESNEPDFPIDMDRLQRLRLQGMQPLHPMDLEDRDYNDICIQGTQLMYHPKKKQWHAVILGTDSHIGENVGAGLRKCIEPISSATLKMFDDYKYRQQPYESFGNRRIHHIEVI